MGRNVVAFRPAVVAPSYNNAATLRSVLERSERLGWPIIVVNDGSTDATAEILQDWTIGRSGVWVMTHPGNRGKGAALRTGFDAAAERGFTHAVTIDTDGQLDPEQIPGLLERAARHPLALVLGYRDETVSDYPARSRLGRRVSNMLVMMEGGVRVRDSQCGMRVYPLGVIGHLRCRAGRYGFETEIITRAAWAGCQIVEAPVRCRYFPPGYRVSHFRPWVDSWRGVGMHARLLARALWPARHRSWSADRNETHGWTWRGLADWLNPLRVWRQLREGDLGRTETAVGVAIGIFIANLPLYGLQTVLALYAARRLHLHPIPVVVGSQASTPPVGVAMVVAAIVVGHVLLHGGLPQADELDPRRVGWSGAGLPLLADWAVGSVVVGFVMAVIGFFVVSTLFGLVRRRETDGVAAGAA